MAKILLMIFCIIQVVLALRSVFPLNSIPLRQYTELMPKKINDTLNPISRKLDFYIMFNWYVLDLKI